MVPIDATSLTRRARTRRPGRVGKNVNLFPGFRFNLDLGQVVPEELGGDLRFVVDGDKTYLEPLGKAKLYLVTKPLPEAAPKKTEKVVVGDKFEPRYFNGTYQAVRRRPSLRQADLKVDEDGGVSGAYVSDKDGAAYDVRGKVGVPPHGIQFTVQFPRAEQTFQGWLFTGDGKAITGSSRLGDARPASTRCGSRTSKRSQLPLDRFEQVLHVHGLLEVAGGAQGGGLLLHVAVGGQDDDGDRGQAGILDLLAPKLPAVHDRHHQVEKDEVGMGAGPEQAQRLLPVGGAEDAEPFGPQDHPQGFAGRGVVLHDEDCLAPCRSVVMCPAPCGRSDRCHPKAAGVSQQVIRGDRGRRIASRP